MPKITIDITQPQLDFLNNLDYQGEIHPINYALSSAILSLQKKCTSDEDIGDLAWLNTTSLKEQQIKQDLEYLDKVAIEAMKELIKIINNTYETYEITIIDNEIDKPQRSFEQETALQSYSYARAMLAEKKRVEAELMGGVGNE